METLKSISSSLCHLSVCLSFLSFFPGCFNRAHNESRKIYIVFRMDDYSAISSTDLEIQIIDSFRSNELTFTIAVTPYIAAGDFGDPSPQETKQLPQEKGDILKDGLKEGVLDVALHGFSHQTTIQGDKTEFDGLSYSEQVRRLSQGKTFLERLIDSKITTFVPPFNRYDRNTLRALQELGFKTLSAGIYGAIENGDNLDILPSTSDLTHLQQAIDSARTAPDDQPLIVVLFHHYDFKEYDKRRGITTLKNFSELLKSLKSFEDIRIYSIQQAENIISDLGSRRFLKIKQWRSVEKFLPFKLREIKPVLLYHEASIYYKTLLKIYIFFGTFTILSGIAALLSMRLFFHLSMLLANVVLVCCLTGTLAIIIYAFKGLPLSPRWLAASLSAIGISIGMICGHILKKLF